MGDLDFAPPVEEIPASSFGGYAKDVQPVKCLSVRVQDNGTNAWVDFAITSGPYASEGTFGMNLYLPTKENLNQKAREKGNKEDALKSFFHYAQTTKAMGIPAGKTIAEAFKLMEGWTGDALFENRDGYGTSVKKVIGSGATATVPTAPAGETDTPF